MAKLGGLLKLDAICAKLKSKVVDDSCIGSVSEQNGTPDPENNNVPIKPVSNGDQDHKISSEVCIFNDVTEKQGVEQETPNQNDGNQRKNRRKASRPRNITQFRDTADPNSEETNENDGQEVDQTNDVLDLSHQYFSRDHQSFELEVDDSLNESEEKTIDISVSNDENGAIDLSVTPTLSDSDTKSKSQITADELKTSTADLLSSRSDTRDERESLASNRVKKSQPHQSGDAAAMKEYAESTMSELLNIYGLGEEAENIAKSVPIQNFASGKILENADGELPLSVAQEKLAASLAKSVASEAALIQRHYQSDQEEGDSKLDHGHIYSKFMDSVSKLSKGNMIGTSPIELPDTAKAQALLKLKLAHAMLGKALQKNHRPSTSQPSTSHAQGPTPNHMLPGKPSGALIDKFATSSEYIKACFSPELASKVAGNKFLLPDYTKYVKRYHSHEECGGNHCKDMGYREHFHCMDCSFRVFVKKEEMIRHFKWHKKRDESLQHGFLRYSPVDDCSPKFGTCTHNGQQTHYHCLQHSCNKVYISTSDVQMHANYHRKDSAIIQEGFQRFRATEDCGTQACSFYAQRTTHFHCRRPGCSFTFKHKADMEKHKTYHQKDEVLSKDGFKKFMKYEHCSYQNCKYSKVSNHIHCIRQGCDYVLHSTGQLYSHKRKHERRDFEHAYRRFKEDKKDGSRDSNLESPVPSSSAESYSPPPSSMVSSSVRNLMLGEGLSKEAEYVDLEDLPLMNQTDNEGELPESPLPEDLSMSHSGSVSSFKDLHPSSSPPHTSQYMPTLSQTPIVIQPDGDDSDTSPQEGHATASTLAKLASKLNGQALDSSLNLPIPIPGYKMEDSSDGEMSKASPSIPGIGFKSDIKFIPKVSPPVNEKREKDESWKRFLTRFTANDACHSRCNFLYKDHYHCNVEGCGMLFKSKDGVREHARYHEQQDRITVLSFKYYDETQACIEDCKYYKSKKHYHCLWANCNHVISDEDHAFCRLEHHKIHEYTRNVYNKKPGTSSPARTAENLKRKRGRPPKYPKTEIPKVPKIEFSEEEIAFKANMLGKTQGNDPTLASGFHEFPAGQPCPDDKCMYIFRKHYHCVRPRCHHATDRSDVLNLHAKDFHSFITILDGFEFFDRNVNCRRPHCHNNKANRHFHCVRPKCDYSFVRYSTMAQHDKKHKLVEMAKFQSPGSVGTPLMIAPSLSPGSSSVGGVSPLVTAINSLASNSLVTTPVQSPIGPIPTVTSPLLAPDGKTVVKAKGTYYPISTIPATGGASMIGTSLTSPAIMTSVQQIVLQSPQILNSFPITRFDRPPGPNLVTIAPKPGLIQQSPTTGMPLTMLLQQKAPSMNPQMTWLSTKMKMHYATTQNCGRPFCKLKKKDHFHCFECNQAFSDQSRLKNHVAKHGLKVDKSENVCGQYPGALLNGSSNDNDMAMPLNLVKGENQHIEEDHEVMESEQESSEECVESGAKEINEAEPADVESSLNLNAGTFQDILNNSVESNPDAVLDLSGGKSAVDNSLNTSMESEATSDLNTSAEGQGSRRSSRKRTATRHDGFIDSENIILLTKHRRLSSPRVPKEMVSPGQDFSNPTTPKSDTPVFHFQSTDLGSPESTSDSFSMAGENSPENSTEKYMKFKANEDCSQYDKCSYRMTTHYHCSRKECGVSFSDRSRLNQHQLRHDRIDSIMGGEFHQFRPNIDCNRQDCELSAKSTHYHCLKCPFICTDTSKVAAHRKYHIKLDNISAQGFEKYQTNEDCGVAGCHHNQKQTHYHCTFHGCNQAVQGPSAMAAHKIKHFSV